jgi:hypothetical protein
MEREKMKSLEGKIFIHSDPETWRTGVVKAATDHAILVQFDCMTGVRDWQFPAELVCMEEVLHAEAEPGMKMWGFFDTREQLDAYVGWMDGLGVSTVVKMVPKTRSGE